MKINLLIIIYLTFFTSCRQPDKVVYFEDFGWTIKLPSHFKIVDTAKVSEMTKTGDKMIKDSTGKKLNYSGRNLITAKVNDENYFTSSFSAFSDVTSENWEAHDSITKELFLQTTNKTFRVQPEIKHSIDDFDGVKFRKLDVEYALNKSETLHIAYLATFYRTRYLSIVEIYTDSALGSEMLRMLKASKFKK